MRKEILWKDVPDTNNRYKANTEGIIFDNKLNKNVPYSKSKKGYLRCHIWINNKRKTIPIHRIIMFTFVEYSKLEVNHIDGNKENNSLCNLEYVTTKENCIHRNKILKIGNMKKIRCLENNKIYESEKEASEDLKIPYYHIGDVCNKKYGFKTVKGYHFEYVG